MTTVVASPAGLLELDGADLGVTDWSTVTQEQIDTMLITNPRTIFARRGGY